jgi:hypothetical protein
MGSNAGARERRLYHAGVVAHLLLAAGVAYGWTEGWAPDTSVVATAVVVPLNIALLQMMWQTEQLRATVGDLS